MADSTVHIEMAPGFVDSFNVSVAAAITMCARSAAAFCTEFPLCKDAVRMYIQVLMVAKCPLLFRFGPGGGLALQRRLPEQV